MSPQKKFGLRDLFLFALGVSIGIVLLVALVLKMGGMFSWTGFARALLVSALLTCVIEMLVARRAFHVTIVRGPLDAWRTTDRTQGCSFAMLGALVALGLLVCGVIMEWLLEFQ